MTQTLFLIFLPIITAVTIYSFKIKHIEKLVLIMQSSITFIILDTYTKIGHSQGFTFVLGGYSKVSGIELKMDRIALAFSILAIIIWWALIFYNYDKIKNDLRFGFFLIFLEGVFLGFL